MLISRLDHALLMGRPRFYLQAAGDDPGGGGAPAGPTGGAGASGTTGATGATGSNDGKPEGVTPEIQKWVGDLLAATRRDAETKARQEAKDAADEAERKRQEQADQAELEAKGEFDTVKQQLTTRATTAEGERDTLRTTNQELLDAMKEGVEADWKSIPEVIAGLYQGKDDDYLARYKYLKDPKVQAAIKAMEDKGQRRPPGNTPDPRRNGGANDAEQERRALQGTGSYSAM